MDIKNSCEPFCQIRGQAYCGNVKCNRACAVKRLSERDFDEYKLVNILDKKRIILCQINGNRCDDDCFICKLPKKVLEEFK